MKNFNKIIFMIGIVSLFSYATIADTDDLDNRVKEYLDTHDWGWGDMNVPAVDGRTLHGIILKNNYTRAVEIGTSTGHSSIWIAWALSKTGGKLITVEIDEQRHREHPPVLQRFQPRAERTGGWTSPHASAVDTTPLWRERIQDATQRFAQMALQ